MRLRAARAVPPKILLQCSDAASWSSVKMSIVQRFSSKDLAVVAIAGILYRKLASANYWAT